MIEYANPNERSLNTMYHSTDNAAFLPRTFSFTFSRIFSRILPFQMRVNVPQKIVFFTVTILTTAFTTRQTMTVGTEQCSYPLILCRRMGGFLMTTQIGEIRICISTLFTASSQTTVCTLVFYCCLGSVKGSATVYTTIRHDRLI